MWLRFKTDSRGATALEYALVASLISVFLLIGIQAVGEQAEASYQEIGAAME